MDGAMPGRISRLAASVLLALTLLLPGLGIQASEGPIAHVQSLAELDAHPAPWMRMAAEVFDSVRALKLKFRPKLRPRFDPRSYRLVEQSLVNRSGDVTEIAVRHSVASR